jgi:hypothetical protein
MICKQTHQHIDFYTVYSHTEMSKEFFTAVNNTKHNQDSIHKPEALGAEYHRNTIGTIGSWICLPFSFNYLGVVPHLGQCLYLYESTKAAYSLPIMIPLNLPSVTSNDYSKYLNKPKLHLHDLQTNPSTHRYLHSVFTHTDI